MRFYYLLIAYLLVANTVFKNDRKAEIVDDSKLPGTTKVPLEEMNPSPNPTPDRHESDVFRGSTINHSAIEAQEEETESQDKLKEKPKKNEKRP